MHKKSWIFLGALILIIASMAFFYSTEDKSQIEGKVILTEEIAPDIRPTPEPVQKLREFNIIAKRFEFIPETITVNQGDPVKLTITSTDVTHGFLISEYNINERLDPGNPVIVEFIADKRGEFPIICNVPCGSGHSSMRGELIVN